MSKKDASGGSGKGKDIAAAEASDAETPRDETADSPDAGGSEPGEQAAAQSAPADGAAGQSAESTTDGTSTDDGEAASRSAGEDHPAPDAKADDIAASESGSEQEPDDGDAAAVADKTDAPAPPPPAARPKPRRSWFGFFNFLLILALGGAGGYYWWIEQQNLREREAALDALRAEIETRASTSQLSRLDGGIASLRSETGALGDRIATLETGQEGLRESAEKLYELFGRDRADWQLAEVEYLMRVAQHKLILEDDFAGAALTLQAASDRIGRTGDPGLLPVRVTISEEVAALKTRERPDLVGMTLTLARLARQVRALQPGFAPRAEETGDGLPQVAPPEDWRDRVAAFIDSLVEVRHESAPPSEIEVQVENVAETLEDNLKLARWAVLDRDARQYSELIDRSLRLLREYYDLDNAANHDFLSELQVLQKMQLRPQKPDITGSLRQMQEILSRRENAPEPAQTTEPVDG